MGPDIDLNLEKFDLPDRYELDSILGEGGIGVVLKARDTVLDKMVAIKMLRSRLSANQAVRFHTEARTLARLNHPNILTALDFQVTEDGNPFLVLDFIEGEDLDSLIEREGPLELEEARDIFDQILDGLDYAHRQGIVHRDIKPSNIMLLEDHAGELLVKIVDFGLSKLFLAGEGDDDFDQKLTATGAMLGSPLYMSPEQARGQPAGPASDIYSLGCVFYRVLTGSPPYLGDTAIETIKSRLEDSLPSLSELRPETEFDEGLEAILSSMLERESQNRPATASEIKSRLSTVFDSLMDPSDIDQSVIEKTVEKAVEESSAEPKRSFASMPLYMVLATILFIASITVIGLYATGKKSKATRSDAVNKAAGTESVIPNLEYDSENPLTDYDRVSFDAKQTKLGFYDVICHGKVQDSDLPLLFKSLNKGDRVSKLSLTDSKVTEAGLRKIALRPAFRSCVCIDLRDSVLHDKDLLALSSFPELNELVLDHCENLTDDGFKNLRDCLKVGTLQIQSLVLSPAGYGYIAELPVLTHLDMRHVRQLDADCMRALAKAPSLTWIEMAGSGKTERGKVTAEALAACGGFKKLRLLGLENIEPEVLAPGLEGLINAPSLRNLSFRGFSKLPEDIGSRLKRLKHLRKVTIFSCPALTEEDIASLASADQIESLSIFDCDLKDKIGALSKLCLGKNLVHLNLDPSAKIYRDQLNRLLNNRTSLEFIESNHGD